MPIRMIRKHGLANRRNAVSFGICLVCGVIYVVLSTWSVFKNPAWETLEALAAIGCLAGALFPFIMAGFRLPNRPDG